MLDPFDYKDAIFEYETLSVELKEAFLYSFPGYSLYLSQNFEKLLMNIIWGHKVINRSNETVQDLNEYFDKYEFGKYPMGALISEVKKKLNLVDEESNKLQIILKQRNYLVHNYFINNEKLLHVANGYKIIIRDFVNYINVVNELHIKLEEYHFQFLENIGYSKEKLNQEIDEEVALWEKTTIEDDFQSIPT